MAGLNCRNRRAIGQLTDIYGTPTFLPLSIDFKSMATWVDGVRLLLSGTWDNPRREALHNS